ncbi:alpha/beta hydrolase [Streptomyces sp. NPDC050698]
MDPVGGVELHTREWGTGDRVAVLLHGMMADSRAWWRVGPALARRGYRVIAVDLPGHGKSPRCADATVESFVAALVHSVSAAPALAIGHSMGGVILAAAAGRLRPERAVYVDTTFEGDSDPDRATLTRWYATAKKERTLEYLLRERSWWSEQDMASEVEAVKSFDVATAVSLCLSSAGRDFTPATDVPSLVVRAHPSRYVTPDVAASMLAQGFTVRSVAGAGHCVWFGFFDAFMESLDGWADSPSETASWAYPGDRP